MTDVVLNPVSSGYNLSIINDNFDRTEAVINNEMLHLVGGNNIMQQDLDMNSNDILNVTTDVTNPGSLLTVGAADSRYYNVAGDTLTGTMNVNNQIVTGVKASVAPTDAVPKQELTAEVNARVAGDNSLQNQILGVNPPMGSAFSTISWHDQSVTNSITIPANKNAWSIGPTMTIAVGQVVTISPGSFWTIVEGNLV